MDLQTQKGNKPKSIMEEADAAAALSAQGAGLADEGRAGTATIAKTAASIVGASGALAPPDALAALNTLCTLLLTKEAREAAKDQLEVDRETSRQAQRVRNAREIDAKFLLRQARCKHLKGGKNRAKIQKIDYAVYPFTFSDADMYIRCQICGMKWRKNDTKEYLSRTDGKGKVHKISNHTKLGWLDALQMADQSSNTGGSSEITQRVMTGDAGLNASSGNRIGLDGIPLNPRVVDLEGNAVSDFEI